MTNQSPSKTILPHFDWTLQRFDEMLRQEKSDYFRDAALDRFGLTFDLALKSLHAFAAEKGVVRNSPREYFKWAGEMDWFGEGQDWDEIVSAYNLIKLSEKGGKADDIYSRLEHFLALFKNLFDNLAKLKPT